jgi:uncharacterized protein (TIGR02466 family)
MYSIIDMFVKGILINDGICTLEERDNYSQFIKDYFDKNSEKVYKYDRVFNTKAAVTFDNKMHLLPELQQLSEKILDSAKQFAKDLGYSNVSERLVMRDMYALWGEEGDYLQMHNHHNSFISGTYYIRSPENSKIFFKRFDDMNKFPAEWNKYNRRQYEVDCIPDRLLMWPSEVPHGTNQQPAGERIAVAFNILMDPTDIYDNKIGAYK